MASKVDTRKAQNALGFAYQYGFPLYAYGRFTSAYKNPKTNVFYHSRALATADFKAVVRPNNDTLYSPCFVDLSQNDLELTVPEFEERYWVFPMTDAYANNYANISSLEGHKPGKYLLRFTKDGFGVDMENVDKTKYEAAINSPTPYGIMIFRILVDSNEEDVKVVNAFQDQIKLTPISRSSDGVPVTPKLDLGIFADLPREDAPKEQLAAATVRLTAAWAPYNPPEVVQDRGWVAQVLETAGLRDGKFTQPPGTELAAAVQAADKAVTALHCSYPVSQELGNDWSTYAPEMTGDYGSFYAQRYHIALVGYLALTRDQVLYPKLGSTAGGFGGALQVKAGKSYLLSFSSRPRLVPTGFWSLTAYGEDLLLIANPLNRYALGDRSGMVLEDGSPLAERDGKFHILIQSMDSPPPAQWTSNWLPTPSDGQLFWLTMRLYGPDEAMGDGSYAYPTLSTIDAITA